MKLEELMITIGVVVISMIGFATALSSGYVDTTGEMTVVEKYPDGDELYILTQTPLNEFGIFFVGETTNKDDVALYDTIVEGECHVVTGSRGVGHLTRVRVLSGIQLCSDYNE